jgi:hypothetical protein
MIDELWARRDTLVWMEVRRLNNLLEQKRHLLALEEREAEEQERSGSETETGEGREW